MIGNEFFYSLFSFYFARIRCQEGKKMDDWKKGGQMEKKLFTCISGVSCESESEKDIR